MACVDGSGGAGGFGTKPKSTFKMVILWIWKGVDCY